MKAPDKIYINGFSAFATEPVKDGIEYIRKDIVDDIIKTAEDHAYFAGSEAMRNKYSEREQKVRDVDLKEFKNRLQGLIVGHIHLNYPNVQIQPIDDIELSIIARKLLENIELFKKSEVDLEKEIRRTYHDGSVGDTSDMDHNDYENIARHFFNLGLNAGK